MPCIYFFPSSPDDGKKFRPAVFVFERFWDSQTTRQCTVRCCSFTECAQLIYISIHQSINNIPTHQSYSVKATTRLFSRLKITPSPVFLSLWQRGVFVWRIRSVLARCIPRPQKAQAREIHGVKKTSATRGSQIRTRARSRHLIHLHNGDTIISYSTSTVPAYQEPKEPYSSSTSK